MNETTDTVYGVHGSTLTNIADAIRDKTGETELMKVADMAENIESIESAPEKKQIDAVIYGTTNGLGLGSIQHLIPYLSEIQLKWGPSQTYYLTTSMISGLSTSKQNPVNLGGITFILDAKHGQGLTKNMSFFLNLFYYSNLYIKNPPKFRIINNDNPEYKVSFGTQSSSLFMKTPDIETFDMNEIFSGDFTQRLGLKACLGDNWSGRTTQTKKLYNMPISNNISLPQGYSGLEELIFSSTNVYTDRKIVFSVATSYSGDITRWPNYTKDNFVNTLESLYDFTGSTYTHQIKLPTTKPPYDALPFSLSDLTEDEIAIATDKGWTIIGV